MAVMAGKIVLPLEQLIAVLDKSSLPRILEVNSGVYFQGSVYELSGSEVCFSTGDLIKVINIDLQSVSCVDVSCSGKKFELPIDHTGLFKVVPEKMPYSSVEEMVCLRPIGLESGLPFTFTCRSKMTLGSFTLGAGLALTVLSIERHKDGEAQVRCHIHGHHEALAEVRIPLSSRGEFYECESEECFTLREIMSSACLRSRRFRFSNITKSEQHFFLTPVYQVQAIMNLRNNVLKFPSSLEVDVADVSDVCKDVNFVTPLSLTEVLSQPNECFPALVDILESPETHSLFKCSWLPELCKSKQLVFHRKGTSTMVLLSSLKGRRAQQYFLVSQQYNGRFRRRPREFNSVYELYVASVQAPGLTVSVTRNCEEVEEEGLPALGVGEQLKVVHWDRMELPCGSSQGQRETVEALVCYRQQEPDDVDAEDEDDEDDGKKEVRQEDEKEQISLPLYMQAHFVEILGDNKKYKLRDLAKEFSLPLDVKVVSRDTELESDPLVRFPCLRIEEAMLEPTVQASFPHRPEHCFDIPVQWLSMSVSFSKEPLPWPGDQPPECRVEWVTEVTDAFFFEFRKRSNSDAAPPPRPPKRSTPSVAPLKKASKPRKKSSAVQKSHHQSGDRVPTKEVANMTLNSIRKPQAPPPPPATSKDEPPLPVIPRSNSTALERTGQAQQNTYVKMRESLKKVPLSEVAAYEEIEHDYKLDTKVS